MSTRYAHILYDDASPPLARITLNRPDKRNPLSPAMIGELVHALVAARENHTVRVVLLTGAGRVFSAGGDLGAMGNGQMGGKARGEPNTGGVDIDDADDDDDRDDAPASPAAPKSLVSLFGTMHQLGKPIVAMVNGHALAGGLGLVVACDLVIASDQAQLGLPEVNVGLWPMMITAELVRNIGRKQTLELMLTGKRLTAAEAAAIGLINRAVPHDELEDATAQLCAQLAARSPAAIALGLRAFYQTQDMEHEEALRRLERELSKVLALEDATEGIMAFLQKREPRWKGR